MKSLHGTGTAVRALILGTALMASVLVAAPARAADDGSMDHAAMAASYQAEAKAAQEKVAEHKQMLERYKNMPVLPKGSAVTKDAMVQHCQKLVDDYSGAAAQATELAKAHQSAAQAAK